MLRRGRFIEAGLLAVAAWFWLGQGSMVGAVGFLILSLFVYAVLVRTAENMVFVEEQSKKYWEEQKAWYELVERY